MLETHMIYVSLQPPCAYLRQHYFKHLSEQITAELELENMGVSHINRSLFPMVLYIQSFWSRDLKFTGGVGFVSGMCYLLCQPNIPKFSQVAGLKNCILSLVKWVLVVSVRLLRSFNCPGPFSSTGLSWTFPAMVPWLASVQG